MSSPTACPGWPAEAAGWELIEAVRPKLRRLLESSGVRPEDSDDVLQQSFLALVQRWHRMDDVVSREAWMVGTLRRTISLHWRGRCRDRRLRRGLAQRAAASEAPAQERQDAARDVAALTGGLAKRDRQLLWLCFGLELKPREAAARLGCQPDSVRKLARRALGRARRRVGAAGAR
jgi:RNA polymerase sigma factor (sigma-70 family)